MFRGSFSTIDFNSGTQKLAVGTHEGAVVMFDLKSASRLYVLEPHRRAVSAVSFSPDGRRLITVSLDEGDVTVWKVGSSISGFFNVGGPPRQGGEKGEPFKRIEFMRADDGEWGERWQTCLWLARPVSFSSVNTLPISSFRA